MKAALKKTFQFYPKLFSYWKILLFVHVISYLATEAISWQQEQILSSGRENLWPIVLVFTANAIAEILFTTLWVVVVVKVIQSISSNKDIAYDFFSDLNRALIESTRALARALRWLPVFIIPGIVKFIRLTFVPFVVVDEPAYKQGSIDALNESEQLTHRHFWFVVSALFLTTFLPSIPGLLLQGENISLASRPLASVTWSVFDFLVGLLTTTFLFFLYRQLRAQKMAKNTGV